MQHVPRLMLKNKNPNNKKDRCLSFVKKTDSEACYIAKQKISSVKKAAVKKIKNVITPSKSEVVKKYKTEQKILSQALSLKKLRC